MVLSNYVTFEEGIPRRLHFTDHSFGDKEILDPVAQITKKVTTLVLVVDREDGHAVSKTLSITSENLASQLAGYLSDRAYRKYDFSITRRGSSFATRYTVDVIPL